MYDGFLQYAGVEVVNMERLMAYVSNGLHPAGVTVMDCTGTCEGLGEALGDGEYTTPLDDEPPWFDTANPDTLDFAGVLPLEVTGLDGSPRTVEMVDLVTRGALPLRPHYGSRTVAVSALLIGRTSAGVAAGLSWLTAVLHRTCDTATLCAGADLVAFTSCPTPICEGGISDPNEPLVGGNVPYDTGWLVTQGSVDAAGDTFSTAGTEIARNYLPNGSGEHGTTGWHKDPTAANAAWGSATLAVASRVNGDPVRVGQQSVRVTFTAVAGQRSAQTQTVTGLTVGRWYSYEQWVYGAGVEAYVQNGATLVNSEATTVATTWVRRVVSFQAAAASVEVGVRSAAVNSSAVLYVDQGSVVSFNGAAVMRTDFEAGTDPWRPSNLLGATPAGAVASSTDRAATGLSSMKITWGPLNPGRWDDVDPALQWDQVDPAITWDTWPMDAP